MLTYGVPSIVACSFEAVFRAVFILLLNTQQTLYDKQTQLLTKIEAYQVLINSY